MSYIVLSIESIAMAAPNQFLLVFNDRLRGFFVGENGELKPTPTDGCLVVDEALGLRVGIELQLCHAIDECVVEGFGLKPELRDDTGVLVVGIDAARGV